MDVVSVVDEELINEVLSMATGIPVFKLTEAESAKLLRMEEELHKRVIGQNEAVGAFAGHPPYSRWTQGSGPPRRLVHLCWPDGCWKDRACQGARRVPVRGRIGAYHP